MAESRCHYCLQSWALTLRGRTRDHIVPGYVGGRQMPRQEKINIVQACGGCNNSKAAGVLLLHCEQCIRAHRAFRAWLVRLDFLDPERAVRYGALYEAAPRLVLADVIGVPRETILQRVAQQGLRATS